MLSTTLTMLSGSLALASSVAKTSQLCSSISPRGSTSLAPLSYNHATKKTIVSSIGPIALILCLSVLTSSGLCEAVIITPIVDPLSFKDLRVAIIPTLNNTESKLSALNNPHVLAETRQWDGLA
jgi:hypothetical protein